MLCASVGLSEGWVALFVRNGSFLGLSVSEVCTEGEEDICTVVDSTWVVGVLTVGVAVLDLGRILLLLFSLLELLDSLV